MTEIHKFSLSYDPAEDRLAWDTEDRAGVTTRLWLTHRLCRGLVNALLPMLQKATAQDVPAGHETTIQSWEQAAAMAEFGKVAPVKPQPQAASGVVRAVHIRPTAEGMNLTFDFGIDEVRTIGIATPGVRQTLAVMHRLYAAAGWPADIWPAWITDTAASAPKDAVN
jgi:hypothetical protein